MRAHRYLEIIAIALLLGVGTAFASSTDGTIDATLKYAWGSRTGWINFGTTGGNVHITSSSVTGYAWSQNYGWINLAPTQSGVLNTSSGVLSGFAWGEQLGYISFNGVIISATGTFTGSATGTIVGTINFDCTNCIVNTDWRPTGVSPPPPPPPPPPSGGGGGGSVEFPPPAPSIVPVPPPDYSILERLRQYLLSLLPFPIPGLPRPVPPQPAPTPLPPPVVPPETPLAFRNIWFLLPRPPIKDYALSPLPKEIQILAKQFPTIGKTFDRLGVRKVADLPKLKNIILGVPGLQEGAHLPSSTVAAHPFGLPPGIPVARLDASVKKQIPGEVVFTRALGEKIDIPTNLSLLEGGQFEKSIRTVAGTVLHLIVKPIGPVTSVTGHLVLKSGRSGTLSEKEKSLSMESMTASLIFSGPSFAEPARRETYRHISSEELLASASDLVEQAKRVEERFELISFAYEDSDHDGIYTADVPAPRVAGEYEIITVIEYVDRELGAREIRLIAVIDPEGYVFEKRNGKEVRIPGAIVTLYAKRSDTGAFDAWPAEEYSQENPQTTGSAGTYAFLVPPGNYYFGVQAPGYETYRGEEFAMGANKEVHVNIELTPTLLNRLASNWQTILLIITLILFGLNAIRNRRRYPESPP